MTLIELVIAMVLISIAVVGVVTAISSVVGRSANPQLWAKSATLAQTYFDEILPKRFDEATPIGGYPPYDASACNIGSDGESRAQFDDVDDYNNLNESPTDQQGNSLPGYNGFSVSVTVTCAGDEVGIATNQAKRITVAITTADNLTMNFSAYRANF